MTSPITPPAAPPSIVLDTDTFRRSENGIITGIVFWRINENAFPDGAWNDFVIVILGWWTSAMIRLLDGSATEEILDLMDGPFSILCEGSAETVSYRFVDRRHGEVVTDIWSGSASVLAEQILTAGKTALQECHQNSWMGRDIELLEKEVNTLRKMI